MIDLSAKPILRAALGTVVLGVATLACRSAPPPLEVVPTVDLERYQGRWYEIASYPQRFQEGCVATRATYTLESDGSVRVLNECRDRTLQGEWRRIEGRAWVRDPEASTAKLEVQFFWPFRGAYWVIDLDPDYRYAVVGHPSRRYLWILARTPRLEEAVYRELLGRIEARGYDLDPLRRTLQPASDDAVGAVRGREEAVDLGPRPAPLASRLGHHPSPGDFPGRGGPPSRSSGA